MAKRDYYEVLGVAKDSSEDAIKKAYRKQAMQHHPDRNPGDAAAETKFKEAAEAYEVLADAEKRKRYDQFGHQGVDGMGHAGRGFQSMDDIFSAFGDVFGGRGSGGGGGSIFEDLFAGARGGAGGGRDGAGASLRMQISIPFRDAVFGCTKTIDLKRHEGCKTCAGTGAKKGTKPKTCTLCKGHGVVRQGQGFFVVQTTCPQCHGRGQVIADPCADCAGNGVKPESVTIKVRIPAGVEDGSRLRVGSEGDAGREGGPRGDLYVDIAVAEDGFFERHGDDVVCRVPVTYSQACLGAEVEVPTLEGKATLKVAAGTQPGEILRMRGQGVPTRGARRGDQLVVIQILVPKKPGKRQEELLRELGELDAQSAEHKGFFDKIKAMFG